MIEALKDIERVVAVTGLAVVIALLCIVSAVNRLTKRLTGSPVKGK